MSDIKTWIERCDEHPDHQSGMISEGMIRARMCEEIEDLRAENERLRAEIARMQELMRGISINMVDLIEQLTRDRDTLLAEVERFREALTDIANQETTGPYKWQLVVARLCEIAREALEGKLNA